MDFKLKFEQIPDRCKTCMHLRKVVYSSRVYPCISTCAKKMSGFENGCLTCREYRHNVLSEFGI